MAEQSVQHFYVWPIWASKDRERLNYENKFIDCAKLIIRLDSLNRMPEWNTGMPYWSLRDVWNGLDSSKCSETLNRAMQRSTNFSLTDQVKIAIKL